MNDNKEKILRDKIKAYEKKLLKEGDRASHAHKLNEYCTDLARKTSVNILFLFSHIDSSMRENYKKTWTKIIDEAFTMVQKEQKKNEDTTIS